MQVRKPVAKPGAEVQERRGGSHGHAGVAVRRPRHDAPEPAEFVLDEIIGCFSEGIVKMGVGGKSRLTCPPALAYGDQGSPPDIAPGATIQFDVELVEIVPATPLLKELEGEGEGE